MIVLGGIEFLLERAFVNADAVPGMDFIAGISSTPISAITRTTEWADISGTVLTQPHEEDVNPGDFQIVDHGFNPLLNFQDKRAEVEISFSRTVDGVTPANLMQIAYLRTNDVPSQLILVEDIGGDTSLEKDGNDIDELALTMRVHMYDALAG